MKQFIIGMVIGASLTGTSVMAVDLAKGSGNPLEHLPVQTQINQIISAVDLQFDNINDGFTRIGEVFADIDRRLTALEAKK